jgi:hypothetical protein
MGEKTGEYIYQIVKDCDGVYCYIKQGEIIRCKDCIYYDTPHVENNYGVRYEYADMPKEAFDKLGTGLVNAAYGINVGGRCTRDYNAGYDDDKRVYVPENNYCGRAERRTDEICTP